MVYFPNNFSNVSPILVLILLFTVQCSERPQTEIPESIAVLKNLTVYQIENELNSSIELIEETSYGNIGDVVIGSVVGVLADSSGRVFIGDYNANKIHVYHSDGSYLSSIGREGDGPGEFRRISQMRIGSELIYIFDRNQRKIDAFSLETLELDHTTLLDFENESNVDISGWMVNSFYLLDDGNYLVQFYIPSRPDNIDEEKSHRLYKISNDRRILSDIILELPVGESLVDRERPFIMEAPYSRKALVTISGENLYKLWTEDFAIQKFGINGEYKSAFYYPVEKSPLNRSQILELFDHEMIRQVIQNATLPGSWPAVNDFIIDDENRFWISRIIDDRELYEWWILEPNGELINRFVWPRSRSIRQIKNGYLYSLNTDEETGEQEIVKYHVNFS